MMVYTPREIDLAWMAGVLEMTKDGAIIVYPDTGLIYKVSHHNRTLTLQNPAKLLLKECQELHDMTRVVAGFFMYDVKEATQ